MEINQKFVITLNRTSTVFNLHALSDKDSLYGVFDTPRGDKTYKGVFIANRKFAGDHKYYVEITLMFGDFLLSERSSETEFEFQYDETLERFGEEKLEGYARVTGCNAEMCVIEKAL